MENVKALLSSNGGWDFARVLIEMDQVGYDAEWAVLNSSDVVPQNRERVYIIGHLRGTSTRQVFPIQRKSRGIASTKIVYEKAVKYPAHQSQIVLSPKGCTPTLTATDYKRPYKIAVRQGGNIVKQNVFSKNSIAATLKAASGSGNIPKMICKPCLTPDRVNKRQHGRRFKENGDPEFTLTSQDKHGVLIEDGKSIAIRKLTPRECWRLQGFTDEQFEKAKKAGISDTQLYKQAGNAVTVDVIEQIGKRLVLEDDETKRSSNFGINNKN